MYEGNKKDSRSTDYVCRKQERLKEYRLCMQETRETQGVSDYVCRKQERLKEYRLCMKETRETQGVSDYVCRKQRDSRSTD